jgi:hypothetical protein
MGWKIYQIIFYPIYGYLGGLAFFCLCLVLVELIGSTGSGYLVVFVPYISLIGAFVGLYFALRKPKKKRPDTMSSPKVYRH